MKQALARVVHGYAHKGDPVQVLRSLGVYCQSCVGRQVSPPPVGALPLVYDGLYGTLLQCLVQLVDGLLDPLQRRCVSALGPRSARGWSPDQTRHCER